MTSLLMICAAVGLGLIDLGAQVADVGGGMTAPQHKAAKKTYTIQLPSLELHSSPYSRR